MRLTHISCIVQVLAKLPHTLGRIGIEFGAHEHDLLKFRTAAEQPEFNKRATLMGFSIMVRTCRNLMRLSVFVGE